MVKGLSSLKRKFKRMPKTVRKRLQATLEQNADELMTAQRALVPKDEGDLEASIRKENPPGRVAVDVRAGGPTTTKPVRSGVSATYDYALGQEFGTQDQPANPFFYPPYRLKKGRFKSRLTRATKKAIKEGVK